MIVGYSIVRVMQGGRTQRMREPVRDGLLPMRLLLVSAHEGRRIALRSHHAMGSVQTTDTYATLPPNDDNALLWQPAAKCAKLVLVLR